MPKPMRPLTKSLVALAVTSACNHEVPLEEFSREASNAFCDWTISCGEFDDADFCARTAGIEQDLAYWILTPDVLRALDNGSVLYDGEVAYDCFEAIRESSCIDTNFEDLFYSRTCLAAIFSGTLDNGVLCWDDFQCVSGSCDVDYAACDLACCAGTCAALPNAVLGQPCPAGYCIDGSLCNYDTETCVPKGGLGADCYDNYECGDELVCLGDKCTTPRGAGELCLGGECGQMGLSCDNTSNLCVAVQHQGALCNPDNDLCGWGLSCNPSTNTCQGAVGIDGPCQDDFDCGDWSLYCDIDYLVGVDGTCRPLKASGTPCLSSGECQSYYCDDGGTCAPEPSCIP